jgi:glutamate N-acetyltransferase/amino-acid N-acetyltransferase
MSIFPASSDQFPLPAGFRWAAVAAGIRYADRNDLAIMDAGRVCSAAATFTRNTFAAAPVTVSRKALSQACGRMRGVVVNAGCANAATGDGGLRNAFDMATGASASVAGGAANGDFLVCSTGTIGVQLPMQNVLPAIKECAGRLAAGRSAFLGFANAILTTDTREKIAWAQMEAGGKTATIIACAKGAGMIYPDMATLLAFVATDAGAEPGFLQSCFSRTIDRSLNCLTVDADTSTNDTAVVLANGASGFDAAEGTPAAGVFEEKLTAVLQSLAKQLARDGEGATKLVEIAVRGAVSFQSARQVALAVANSNLVKTAIYGRDANWGRIVCAVGNSGVPVDPARVSVQLCGIPLFSAGAPVSFDEEAALRGLSAEHIPITIDLGAGNEQATAWTCDMTEKYIEINGSYRT